MHEEVSQTFPSLELEIAFVNRTESIVEPSNALSQTSTAFHPTRWMFAGRSARPSWCSAQAKTFLHPILSDPDDGAPQFTCPDEDPVIVNLTDDERSQLERAV